jgi:hypothetical protein
MLEYRSTPCGDDRKTNQESRSIGGRGSEKPGGDVGSPPGQDRRLMPLFGAASSGIIALLPGGCNI